MIVTVQDTDALSRLCSHGPSDLYSRRGFRKSLPGSSAAAVTVSLSDSLTGIGCRLHRPGPAVGLSRSRSPVTAAAVGITGTCHWQSNNRSGHGRWARCGPSLRTCCDSPNPPDQPCPAWRPGIPWLFRVKGARLSDERLYPDSALQFYPNPQSVRSPSPSLTGQWSES